VTTRDLILEVAGRLAYFGLGVLVGVLIVVK
jgi:hypothetical protein